jgi:hypothetical protein
MTTHRLVITDAVELAELLIEGLVTRGEIPVGSVATAHIEGGNLSFSLESPPAVVVTWDEPAGSAS